jgi:hypothetical protein
MEQIDFGGEIVWRPTQSHIENSNLKRFMDRCGIGSFDELMKRSTEDIAWFWDAMLREMDVRFDTPYSKVVDLGKGVQFPRWCVGGRMNIGGGRPEDAQLILDLVDTIEGKCFCALGDAAAWAIQGAVKRFPEDFKKYLLPNGAHGN